MPTIPHFIYRGLALFLLLMSCLLPLQLQAAVATPTPNLAVQVVDGTKADAPLTSYEVHVRELLADSSSVWRTKGKTDASGKVSFALDGLGAGKRYVLQAKSTFNNTYKQSAVISTVGAFTFRVGTPLLQASLKDTVSGTALANTKVTAYRLKADGTSVWRAETSTDASGVVRFDLPELLEGDKAQLFASPYNAYRAASPVFSQPGNVVFPVGDVRVTVTDKTQTPAVPFANQKVTIVEKMADGKEVWRSEATTDAAGRLRLTLFTQGAGREYLLKAKSPFNQSWKTSQGIKQAGDYQFAVGSQPLPVTLKDVSTGKTLAGIQITAYQVLADGKLQWKNRQTTDANGQTSFDLPELSSGGTIRLQATAFNNFGAWSRDITTPAAFEFGLGSVQVTVRDGTQAEGVLLPNLEVHIRENKADGTSVWYNKAITDTAGKLKIDLPGLDSGRTFFLQAMHPVTKRYKSSQPLSKVGEHTFMVGTRLLTVNLRNAISQTPLADKDVTLHEVKVVEGSTWPYVWTASAKTDANGVATLDSDKLSQPGLTFALSVTPYNAGRVMTAHFPAQTYRMDFPVGTIPVTLLDKDNGNAVMAGKRIDAYEIMADGKLQWRKNGTTDAAGQVVFDLETLRTGTRHVFKASNPFANNKYPYSRIITAEGAVTFAISRNDDGKLDLKPPVVEILAPSKTNVGDFGFELSGKASDDKVLERVEVKLVSGSLSNTRTATLDKATGNWKLVVSATDLQSGQTLAVTATAVDTTGNASSTTRNYQVLADSGAPSITVTSHTDNESVLKTGFLLQGTVMDDTSISSLQVTVTDASGKVLVAPKALNPTPAGDWAYALANGILSQDSQISVSLTATDATGKQGNFTLALTVAGSHEESRQLLSRATFGITDALLQDISRDGTAAFLEQQLNPAGIDDSAFRARLSTTNPVTLTEFQSYTLQHMIGSRRQLQEVMAWFWENHFNTDFRKTGNKLLYELAENDAFRANALGNFRNLLDASAKSPAMLYYLDSVKNVREDSNENYARELLELHTVGVDGGYTQKEVEVLAEVFTGWQVQNDRFFFNAAQHNSSNKVFWGNTIPAGGVDEGEKVLDILARHPATANYLCAKLVTQFVSDQPVNSLQGRCAETFLAQASAPDQMAQVLRVILTAPEFYATANINSKVKTPLEFVTASARAVEAKGTYADLPAVLKRMGMDLFQNPLPTGYSDTGDDWVSPVALQERVRCVNLLANARSGASYVDTNLFKAKGSVTAESIASDLLNWTIGGYYAELEWQTALEVLNADGAFDPNASNADARIRETIGTVLSYPEFNYQ